ncbi:MAG: hypothetical protein C3F14_08835 [Deltaproteobacteria bacterium]|nr:MAG: hypothetical protein C3F14_08835 [Deltaproteobacteria bacterium]
MVRIKRVYEAWDRSDGARILVDRLWPRGIAREAARIEAWRKELAPTGALREWFDHDPRKWEEFQVRYRSELEAAGKMEELKELAGRAKTETVTLLYAAHDETRNNAVVLKKIIEKFLKGRSAAA